MTVIQNFYLQYIDRRLKKATLLEGPPFPFDTFKQIWQDRMSANKEGRKTILDSINLLLFIEEEYTYDDLYGLLEGEDLEREWY